MHLAELTKVVLFLMQHPERAMVTSQYEESPPTTERRVEINTQPEVKNLTTAS